MEQFINIRIIIILVCLGKAFKELNKMTKWSNSWILFILYVIGTVIGLYLNPSLDGAVSGLVSGMLAVSVHQTGIQGWYLIKEGKFSELFANILGNGDKDDVKEEDKPNE